jgi:hypothetical protein
MSIRKIEMFPKKFKEAHEAKAKAEQEAKIQAEQDKLDQLKLAQAEK